MEGEHCAVVFEKLPKPQCDNEERDQATNDEVANINNIIVNE